MDGKSAASGSRRSACSRALAEPPTEWRFRSNGDFPLHGFLFHGLQMRAEVLALHPPGHLLFEIQAVRHFLLPNPLQSFCSEHLGNHQETSHDGGRARGWSRGTVYAQQ